MKNEYKNISVVLADTQFLTNEALNSILSPLFRGFYTVWTMTGLKPLLQKENISLIITDYIRFDFDSASELGNLKKKYPSIATVVLTNSITYIQIKELNDIGIKNIILKTDDQDELFHAIDAALKGKKYYSGEVLDSLLKRNAPSENISILTTSEIDIVRLIASGLSTKEIAVKKHNSFHTVMTHRKNIFRKLGVSSSPELLMYAIKAGLIDNIEYHI
ncbi:MAG: DNA-binding response regulator [Chlorobium sp.]